MIPRLRISADRKNSIFTTFIPFSDVNTFVISFTIRHFLNLSFDLLYHIFLIPSTLGERAEAELANTLKLIGATNVISSLFH